MAICDEFLCCSRALSNPPSMTEVTIFYRSSQSGVSPIIFYSETDPVLECRGLRNRFKNWQRLRKHKLTASTFAMAVDFWPRRRIQLWLEKLGAIEPFAVSFPEFQVYRNDNWLAASPDGSFDSLIYGLSSVGVLEIECPLFDGDKSKATPWKRIQLYYIPQAQGLMEILDRDWMELYVWTLNGRSLFSLHRNKEYWDVLKMPLSDFWWKHVQPAKEELNLEEEKKLVSIKALGRPRITSKLASPVINL
ncbi:unnamed protein product [Fraxinus pennsylvanica]|uniref:YqaJ viral recombinase domain-containing protein n=1 Tax=Fraxinus pennsylvanica TaxID=56036 RepID=A0AAD1Z9J5_9LAMI|nr:unnamed protein product [Fraxinus pennsylvanica]